MTGCQANSGSLGSGAHGLAIAIIKLVLAHLRPMLLETGGGGACLLIKA